MWMCAAIRRETSCIRDPELRHTELQSVNVLKVDTHPSSPPRVPEVQWPAHRPNASKSSRDASSVCVTPASEWIPQLSAQHTLWSVSVYVCPLQNVRNCTPHSSLNHSFTPTAQRERDRETHREREREKERETQRESERERERERERGEEIIQSLTHSSLSVVGPNPTPALRPCPIFSLHPPFCLLFTKHTGCMQYKHTASCTLCTAAYLSSQKEIFFFYVLHFGNFNNEYILIMS